MSACRSFTRILVANRGEIALRVMRSARAAGFKTVAVYSDADAGSPHVAFADDAVRIGPAPAQESYLDGNRVLAAAHSSGADAIHPGYGFLSENAGFATACADAGVIFIGPPVDAVRLMGNKAEAKRRMRRTGVPCIPGYDGDEQEDSALMKAGAKVGFPLMVKAAAGGGGRGMRLVESADTLPAALVAARSEAESAFGSGELILEKAIVCPRHVEIQVFADQLGNVVHLGERDCSIQRRHQKVIEESPCPVMTEPLRQAMGDAAVEAARAIDYVGAGTVEFLLDSSGDFYFLEMNTRLQVEHPVTEMVTGLDLVALQLRVAGGEPLGIEQSDIQLDGHAIEARLYAEDPAQDFLPAAGVVHRWQAPGGQGIRTDAGITSGINISSFYDPMLAKIIAHGPDRATARTRLSRALEELQFFGPPTNRAFLAACLKAPAFVAGEATTAFIAQALPAQALQRPTLGITEAAMAAVIFHLHESAQARERSLGVSPELVNWSNRGVLATRYTLTMGEVRVELTVCPDLAGANRNEAPRYRIRHDDTGIDVTLRSHDETHSVFEFPNQRRIADYCMTGPGTLALSVEAETYVITNQLAEHRSDESRRESDPSWITSPMHGKVLEVEIQPGDRVQAGQRVITLEAMKMQHEIFAEADGIVTEVRCEAGGQVADQDVLAALEVDCSDPG